MIQVCDIKEFKRISYAIMSAFNNIEAITISKDYFGNRTLDFWKTNAIHRNRYGIYIYNNVSRHFDYCDMLINRNKTKLIDSIPITENSVTDNTYIDRNNILFPYKHTNRICSDIRAKNYLSTIAKLLNLKEITIGGYGKYTFKNNNDENYIVNLRGAGGEICYRGTVNF